MIFIWNSVTIAQTLQAWLQNQNKSSEINLDISEHNNYITRIKLIKQALNMVQQTNSNMSET